MAAFKKYKGYLNAFKVSGALISCHVLDILIAIETVTSINKSLAARDWACGEVGNTTLVLVVSEGGQALS